MINAFKRGLITNKMSFKFAANIGMMFKEAGDIDKRYEAAKNAGFSAVECAFPYSIPAEQLVKSKEAAGICQALINTYPGNLEAGDLGMASIPHRKKDFEDSLNLSITYAKALNCKRIHIMSGKEPGFKDAAMDDCYVTNLKYAAERLEKEGITALIEPINTRLTAPRYFLNTLPKALDCIKKVNHPNLKLQLDIFHLQILHGNLTYMLEEYLPFTDYIQIAQAPNRDEPNALGEINYVYIFELLKNAGYSGYIGLEYNPKGDTVDGLKWMQQFGLTP